MTARLQIDNGDGVGLRIIGNPASALGADDNPYDPEDAQWDSVGDDRRALSGRLVTQKRKGITLIWSNLSGAHCDALLQAYYDLVTYGFVLRGIIVPPKKGATLGTWQTYTGHPATHQGIFVDEPVYSYAGPLVDQFRWHFASVTSLVTP